MSHNVGRSLLGGVNSSTVGGSQSLALLSTTESEQVQRLQNAEIPVIRDNRGIEARPDGTLICQRRGCGAVYRDTEDENPSHACWHHPGGPRFIEGGKEWSCCGARGATFSEFAAITGCLVSRHTQDPAENPEEVKAVVHVGNLNNDVVHKPFYSNKWTNKSLFQGPAAFDLA